MTANILKPMLAATANPDDVGGIEYPVQVSPKLDGIRVLVHPEHGPVTRKFKALPNRYLRALLDDPLLHGLDGELVVTGGTFNETQSAVMSIEGEPAVEFHVFDDFTEPHQPFSDRLMRAMHRIDRNIDAEWIKIVPHFIAVTPSEVKNLAAQYAADGFEGAMIRSKTGPYKQGRSTVREGYLLKLKDFMDTEGVVVGVEERMHNTNEAELDELGYAKRSSAKAGKTAMGMLGALILDTAWGEIRVGTGFTDQQRTALWEIRERLRGETVTFKYQASGMHEKPRFPVFLHFRDVRG